MSDGEFWTAIEAQLIKDVGILAMHQGLQFAFRELANPSPGPAPDAEQVLAQMLDDQGMPGAVLMQFKPDSITCDEYDRYLNLACTEDDLRHLIEYSRPPVAHTSKEGQVAFSVAIVLLGQEAGEVDPDDFLDIAKNMTDDALTVARRFVDMDRDKRYEFLLNEGDESSDESNEA